MICGLFQQESGPLSYGTMLRHKAILYALSRQLNKWAHFYWNSSTPSILLLWINVTYFCHWLIHRVFSCNLQKHLVNHWNRNYKIKCFFPFLTLALGARLSGGGVREGCVAVHRVSCQQFLPHLLISDQSLGDTRTWRNLLAVLNAFTLQTGLAVTPQLWVGCSG